MSTSCTTMAKKSTNLKILSPGKKNFNKALKLIVVMALPVICLLSMSGVELSNSLNTNRDVDRAKITLTETLILVKLIVSLQNEKGMGVIYMSTPDQTSLYQIDQVQLETDEVIQQMESELKDIDFQFEMSGTVVTLEGLSSFLHKFRVNIYTRVVTVEDIILFYSGVNGKLMDIMVQDIDLPDGESIWRKYVSSTGLLPAADALGVQRAIGSQCFTYCNATTEHITWLVNFAAEAQTHIITAIEFESSLKGAYGIKMKEIKTKTDRINDLKYLITSGNIDKACRTLSDARKRELAMEWYGLHTEFIKVLMSFVNEGLDELSESLNVIVKRSKLELAGYSIFMCLAVAICSVLGIWYISSVNKLTLNMSEYAEAMKEKNDFVADEKQKTELLLYQLLPKSVADQLKTRTEVSPEYFSSVTIYLSDIVGFTSISAGCSPHEIIDLLNSLYRTFDNIIEQHDVYKVETIGDAYMVVSGLPKRNGVAHATEIAFMSMELLKSLEDFECPYTNNQRLELRIGVHSGSVAAGVVGVKMPRYCLFGDTVSVANGIESTGQALKIHISDATNRLLSKIGGFYTEKRENIEVKGKGMMTTFWLHGYGNASGTSLHDIV